MTVGWGDKGPGEERQERWNNRIITIAYKSMEEKEKSSLYGSLVRFGEWKTTKERREISAALPEGTK